MSTKKLMKKVTSSVRTELFWALPLIAAEGNIEPVGPGCQEGQLGTRNATQHKGAVNTRAIAVDTFVSRPTTDVR